MPDKNKIKHIDKIKKERNSFRKRIVRLNALACSNVDSYEFDLDIAELNAKNGISALGAKNSLQEMLAAQMLSIHRYQQLAIAMANGPNPIEIKQYFTNAAIKLANTFVQQANLLNKLQGNGEQKIIVEHVDVHNG